MTKKAISVLLFSWVSLIAWSAFAQETPPASPAPATPSAMAPQAGETNAPVAPSKSQDKSMNYLAIGLAIGLAALGGAIAQGLVGSSAMAGVARNPGSKSAVQTLLVLTLVLIESLVIYALVVSLLLYAKL